MRRPAKFTQADLKRAVSGATSAGILIRRIEIDPATGKIVILPFSDRLEHDNDAWEDLE